MHMFVYIRFFRKIIQISFVDFQGNTFWFLQKG